MKTRKPSIYETKKISIILAIMFIIVVVIVGLKSEPLLNSSNDPELKPEVKKNIKLEDVISLTQRLVRIRSDYDEGVVANHKELANFLADYMRKLGMEVHVIEPEPNYPTVIGRPKRNKREATAWLSGPLQYGDGRRSLQMDSGPLWRRI